MRRRRITRKPTKGESLFSGVIACAMGCFGLFVIPDDAMEMTAFKYLWCLIAFGMGIYHFLIAAGKVKMGGYEITDEDAPGRRTAESNAEERLSELKTLYDRSFITAEEYEAKRRDILSGL